MHNNKMWEQPRIGEVKELEAQVPAGSDGS